MNNRIKQFWNADHLSAKAQNKQQNCCWGVDSSVMELFSRMSRQKTGLAKQSNKYGTFPCLYTHFYIVILQTQQLTTLANTLVRIRLLKSSMTDRLPAKNVIFEAGKQTNEMPRMKTDAERR